MEYNHYSKINTTRLFYIKMYFILLWVHYLLTEALKSPTGEYDSIFNHTYQIHITMPLT